ncbi:MAG: phosphopantetheine-binding protein [Steroidobacteraceae bacterium]
MPANASLTADELAMAQHLVQALSLDGVEPGSIAPEATLFGNHADGLGLDSIDALEIALMVQQHYGVELRSEDQEARAAFTSLRTLTRYVLEHRKPN